MIDKRARHVQEFGFFLQGYMRDLNQRAEEGWAILVEGRRDEKALRLLGYRGRMATVSAFSRRGSRVFGDSDGVMILTDLDREGGLLAARFMKKLPHVGLAASLAERKRLKSASRGVFLHIENLGRFGETMDFKGESQEFITT